MVRNEETTVYMYEGLLGEADKSRDCCLSMFDVTPRSFNETPGPSVGRRKEMATIPAARSCFVVDRLLYDGCSLACSINGNGKRNGNLPGGVLISHALRGQQHKGGRFVRVQRRRQEQPRATSESVREAWAILRSCWQRDRRRATGQGQLCSTVAIWVARHRSHQHPRPSIQTHQQLDPG